MFYVADQMKSAINRFIPRERAGKRFRAFANTVEPKIK